MYDDNGCLRRAGNPATLYQATAAEGTKANGPARTHAEKVEQTRALRVLAGMQVVYAVQFPRGVIKIGCTNDMAQRLRSFRGKGAVVVGFMPGDFEDERAIHAQLRPHRARGHEYYHPTPAVLAVVNEMREAFNLPPIAA